jgi:hypothetical protein
MISEKLKHGFLSFLKMVSNGRIIHIESIEINYSDRPISIASVYGNDIRILEGNIFTTIKVTGKYPIWDIELVDMERKFQSTFSPQLNGTIIKLDYSVLDPNSRW